MKRILSKIEIAIGVVMDAHDVSTDQSFETEAHSKKGTRDDKVSGASEKT